MAIGKPVELAAHMAGLVDSEGTVEEKGKALRSVCSDSCLDQFADIVETAINTDPEATGDNPEDSGDSEETPEELEG